MSAFISAKWQSTQVRIPDTHVTVPVEHLPEMTARVLDQASPETVAEAQEVMHHGGSLSGSAQIELAHLIVKHAQDSLG